MSLKDCYIAGGQVLEKKAAWKWQQNGEKYMIRGGTTGLIASGLYAIKKTADISDLLKETKADIAKAEESGDKKAVRKAKWNRAKKAGKYYLLPGAGAVISTMMIDKGMAKAGEKTAMIATTAALYATTLRNYRKNVIAEYGPEVDRKFMTTEKVKGNIEEVKGADGSVKKAVQEDGVITLPVNPNALRLIYSRSTTPSVWHWNHALRKATLDNIERELDILLISQGHITLNDMRRKFGGIRMDVGIGGVLGRVWDPGNPENPRGGRRVRLHWEEDEDFVNGRKDWCWILFDVDDEPLIGKIDEKWTEMESDD